MGVGRRGLWKAARPCRSSVPECGALARFYANGLASGAILAVVYLDELIAALDAEDPNLIVPLGFARPHSYRGYYSELAFEPALNVTVGSMLAAARSAKGATYQGWKGGDYTMDGYTDCWLAEQGRCGESIGPVLLALMLAADGTDLRLRAKLAAFEPETVRWAREAADA